MLKQKKKISIKQKRRIKKKINVNVYVSSKSNSKSITKTTTTNENISDLDHQNTILPYLIIDIPNKVDNYFALCLTFENNSNAFLFPFIFHLNHINFELMLLDSVQEKSNNLLIHKKKKNSRVISECLW